MARGVLERLWGAIGPAGFRAKVGEVFGLMRETKRLERRSVLKFKRAQFQVLYNAALARRRAELVFGARRKYIEKVEKRYALEERINNGVFNQILTNWLGVTESVLENSKAQGLKDQFRPKDIQAALKATNQSITDEEFLAASRDPSVVLKSIQNIAAQHAAKSAPAEKHDLQFSQHSTGSTATSQAPPQNAEAHDPKHMRLVAELAEKYGEESTPELVEEYLRTRSAEMGGNFGALSEQVLKELNLKENLKDGDIELLLYKRLAQMISNQDDPVTAVDSVLSTLQGLSDSDRERYKSGILAQVRNLQNAG